MTLVRLFGMAAALAALAAGARADDLSYDDPAMHFEAPPGWTRVALPPADGAEPQQGVPAAVFVWHRGAVDQRTIVLQIEPFQGTLDGFERQRESELRQGGDGTFVDKKTLTKLANGMPAYVLKISSGNEAGKFVRRYDYLATDGKRSIDVQFVGRQGDFGDADVESALASLYVVLYPPNRS